jgi:hypothetical protein
MREHFLAKNVTRTLLTLSLLSAAAPCQAGAPGGTLVLVHSSGTIAPSNLVQVTLRMVDVAPATPAAGFQAFLTFDTTRLSFVNGLYTSNPFGLHIIAPITAVGNTIDLAAGINTFVGQPPTSADSDLVVLTFQVLTQCGLDVDFRPHNPPTRLSNALGDAILPLTLSSGEVSCAADVSPNGAVDVDDLITVILHWGNCASAPPACCPGDTNASGAVDVDDLIAVILSWGSCT